MKKKTFKKLVDSEKEINREKKAIRVKSADDLRALEKICTFTKTNK